MFGEQWICACAWHNFALRSRCRNCGHDRPAAPIVETIPEVMAGVQAHNVLERAQESARR